MVEMVENRGKLWQMLESGEKWWEMVKHGGKWWNIVQTGGKLWELVGNGTKCMPGDPSFFVFQILLVSMCSMWVYVFNVFFVGLTRLHRSAKPSSAMTQGSFRWTHPPPKLTITIFSSSFFLMIIRRFITICYFPFSWKIDKSKQEFYMQVGRTEVLELLKYFR